MGVPWSGPADDWSMALANWLVGNAASVTAIEITFGVFEAAFEVDAYIALTGAEAPLELAGERAPFHETCFVPAGTTLKLGGARTGMRTYLAIAGGIEVGEFLGSTSTYLPAGFGGHEGRTLRAGDVLSNAPYSDELIMRRTPVAVKPILSDSYTLRAVASAESELLEVDSFQRLFDSRFTIGLQATRMGVSLDGAGLSLRSDGKMKSAAVFPGTIQCPEDGTPIILLADAQTTGGYPRIASIASCDRHLLGQLRPGDCVRLLKRTHESAINDLDRKLALLRSWVPDYGF